MARVVPDDLRRILAMVQPASSRGPAKATLFLPEMIVHGRDG